LPDIFSPEAACRRIAAEAVSRGGPIFLPGGCAQPTALISQWAAQASSGDPMPVVSVQGMWVPGINAFDPTLWGPGVTSRGALPQAGLSAGLAAGRIEIVEERYTQTYARMAATPFAVVVAHVSVPRADGTVSLGLAADSTPAVLANRAAFRVMLVNEQMPDHPGAPRLSLEDADVVVRVSEPLASLAPEATDPALEPLVENVVSLVEDGDALQFGIGRLPGQILSRLAGQRRGLRIHSGMYADGVVDLLERGSLSDAEDALCAGIAIGAERLYGRIAQEQRARFRPVPETHGLSVLSEVDRFVALNSALEVDLGGALNAAFAGSRRVSGAGGLPDFVAGANASRGGRAIIAMPATAKGGSVSRIVAKLPSHAVTLTGEEAVIVVTEFGIADLRGKAPNARAEALIGVAAPAFRAELGAAVP
jgi:acyl-CoA hydrolase